MSQNFDGKSAVGDFKKGLDSLDFKSFYTTNTGRINRQPYLFYFVIPAIVANIVLGIIAFFVPFVAYLSYLVVLAGICPGVKRLHDLNYTGWLYLLTLLPVIGLILIIILCAKPGIVGANQFGEDPLKG
jgi:uncharacterized membrane protein YhaH (DUF805 family)